MLFRSLTNTKSDSGQNLIDIGAVSLARCTGSTGNIKHQEERIRKGILLATSNSLSQLFVWTELPDAVPLRVEALCCDSFIFEPAGCPRRGPSQFLSLRSI